MSKHERIHPPSTKENLVRDRSSAGRNNMVGVTDNPLGRGNKTPPQIHASQILAILPKALDESTAKNSRFELTSTTTHLRCVLNDLTLSLSQHNNVHSQIWKDISRDRQEWKLDVANITLRNKWNPIAAMENYTETMAPQLASQCSRRVRTYVSTAGEIVIDPDWVNPQRDAQPVLE